MKKTMFSRKIRVLLFVFCIAAAILAYVFYFTEIFRFTPVFFPGAASNRTVVIDPGHGGIDGGAVGVSGVMEKELNLAIAEKTNALFCFFGIPTVMTREEDVSLNASPDNTVRENKNADLKARGEIVKNTPNPVLLSIHMNKFGKSSVNGAQVFYSDNHMGSRQFASALQATLREVLDPENQRQAKVAEGTIYLMRTSECPALIVECGFLSNAKEEARLMDPAYQTKVAVALLGGYERYLNGKWADEE